LLSLETVLDLVLVQSLRSSTGRKKERFMPQSRKKGPVYTYATYGVSPWHAKMAYVLARMTLPIPWRWQGVRSLTRGKEIIAPETVLDLASAVFVVSLKTETKEPPMLDSSASAHGSVVHWYLRLFAPYPMLCWAFVECAKSLARSHESATDGSLRIRNSDFSNAWEITLELAYGKEPGKNP
jgi:hypothetical protein